MPMVINTKDNSLMDYLKVMENIPGLMAQCIKEISSKEPEMDMDFGEVAKDQIKTIKDIICLIKSMGMVSMTGQTDMSIKVFGWMIYVMEKENCFSTDRYSMMDIGKMGKKLIKNQI